MQIHIFDTVSAMGAAAGQKAALLIANSISTNGKANIILATGSSQFEILSYLINDKTIDWAQVTMFHLDEYIGISDQHPASFRKYITERFLEKVQPLKAFYLINGEGDAALECQRLIKIIQQHPIDVALVGIGENGHLAFNDPPADFETEDPYILVDLDLPCRQQQMGEGWFTTIDSVPTQAISMSIRQIMKSAHIVCTVPDERKAIAVKNCLQNKVSNLYPASILQMHDNCHIYLDKFSASLMSR